MSERYTGYNRSLVEAILDSPGETSTALRHASEAHSAQLNGRVSSQKSQLPTEVERYLSKMALHAYKVTDEDIEALRTAGYDEDALFELTLSAALGAGMARLERGMAALKGDTHAAQED